MVKKKEIKMWKAGAWNNSTKMHLISWISSPLKTVLLTIHNDFFFFYWGSAPQGEGKNACLCRCQQPGKGFWLLSTIQVLKKNKPSDIDAKGLVQYFHQAWGKKTSLTLSLHSQTEHTSQSKNTGMASVGVCQRQIGWDSLFLSLDLLKSLTG